MTTNVPRTWSIAGACLAVAVLVIEVQLRAAALARTGSVEGSVTVVSKPSRRLSSAGAYPGRTVSVSAAGVGSELANVIVFVDLAERAAARPGRATIRQSNEVFSPAVVAIATGSTVEFPNDDSIFHNVFSLSRAATFDLGRYPRGQSRGQRFDKPGVVKVFCHLHSHMTALVRVFDHPYFVIPDADGRFVIPDVPAGPHRVVAWHERAGEVTHTGTVADGTALSLTFTLPLTDPR